ncbi:M3 family oligoendopeptidase [Alicyclobacillus ferrooxydans]|uniref:M3 family oligoendopeptidase n=1 Tax=Alicyclobacillus ferrooxydans TaxID=471514 RepID=UPI0006D55322|nr:M3 family oligoendopeptidase [Alicyclobacillus ferrooxydans]
MSNIPKDYYAHCIDVSDAKAVEAELEALLNQKIESVEELQTWLQAETTLSNRLSEVLMGHQVDFARDTEDEERKRIHLHDQAEIMPLLTRYEAKFNEKFYNCPFTKELDDSKYGLMKKVRFASLELFREENIPLEVKASELVTEYQALMAGLTVSWDGEQQTIPFVMAQVDSPVRSVREQAWTSLGEAYASVKPRVDEIMDELVKLRHQIAVNAGFENYRDYTWISKSREYSIEDIRKYHAAVEKYVVPVWDEIAEDFRASLGVESFRPWDNSNCTISKPPYDAIAELTDGVEKMLRATDPVFGDLFAQMNSTGLIDLGSRKGKGMGGFYVPFPVSNHGFVFANFSPSFFSLIALVHEMGQAVNLGFQLDKGDKWQHWRMEVAELFSHSMELLCLDKLNVLYTNEADYKEAIRQRIRRSIGMLMGPLAGDKFQHWMYENPNHTAAERDAMFAEIQKTYFAHPVDYTGYESRLGSSWVGTEHFFQSPFYQIEYAMAELGALQMLKNYREDPKAAIAGYKRGASADDSSLPISAIYESAGVKFDFSDELIQSTAEFVRRLWKSI